jgi:DNA-binding PadR family transcriptional regulator
MDKINAKQAMKELTMALIYLSRFTDGEKFFQAEDYYAWKGYSFDILNQLNDADYIRQGSRPSRSKSVYITDTGKMWAKELLEKFRIEDWKQE